MLGQFPTPDLSSFLPRLEESLLETKLPGCVCNFSRGPESVPCLHRAAMSLLNNRPSPNPLS